MKALYPKSFTDIRIWAEGAGVAILEARIRFAQFAILRAIASSRTLSSALVLKGGNALDFVWQPNRSTIDLDFSVDMGALEQPPSEALIRRLFEPALDISTRDLAVAFKVYKIDQQPPGPNKTFITYRVKIGYVLPDEKAALARMQKGIPVSTTIPVDISLNEPICSDAKVDVAGTFRLRVSEIEDIVAEKLRALLQQRIRNRFRRQDLLDIAVTWRSHPEIDLARVSAFLLEKAKARGVPVSRAAFFDPALAERARESYDGLRKTTRAMFVPFDEALDILRKLVTALDIPDEA